MEKRREDAPWRPNPSGSYPICRPSEDDHRKCDRCGTEMADDRTCPASTPAERWGPVRK